MNYSGKSIAKSLTMKFVEQLAVKVTSLVVGIVLARILDVTEFGVVAILTVFVHICSAVIEGGLSTSLIQKKDVDSTDYSTVFFSSFLIAIVMYCVLFFVAPLIADIYEEAMIVPYLRVIGITLFVTPFNAVQLGYVYKRMLFHKLLVATLTASIFSGVIGIAMAYAGFGAWALVTQTILNSVVSVIMLLFLLEWRPKSKFSLTRLKEHFSYGWKLLVSSLIDTLYNEMRTLLIGHKYNSNDLAYYNRGDTYPKTIMTSLNTAIQTVMFPVLSSVQDESMRMKAMMRKSVALSSFVVFPIMAGFAAIAESFVVIVLTEKWLPCVPYLRLACVIYAIQPINSCNLQSIKAIGRSDVYLLLDLIKKAIGFTLLFISAFAFDTPMAIAIASAIYAPIQLLINAYPNKKLIHYSFFEQVKDISIPLLMSGIMFFSVDCMKYLSLDTGVRCILQIAVGMVLYIALSFVFRVPAMKDILSQLRAKRKDA